jgi:hypothetical protein
LVHFAGTQQRRRSVGAVGRKTEFFGSWSIGALEHRMCMGSPIGTGPGPASQWVWEVDGVGFRPTACFIPAQGNALGSSAVFPLQANGLPHSG